MSADTRSLLLETARKLIKEEGLEALSMRKVGRETGLSHTAMYRHFRDKDDLLAALVSLNLELLGEAIGTLGEQTGRGRALLEEVLNHYFRFGMAQPDMYQLMFNTPWDSEIYPELKQTAEGVFALVAEIVGRSFSESTADGQSARIKTAVIYAFIHGLVELHLAGHAEPAKGLDDPGLLIRSALDALV